MFSVLEKRPQSYNRPGYFLCFQEHQETIFNDVSYSQITFFFLNYDYGTPRKWFCKRYFNEDKESFELGSNVKHEPGVSSKPLNISFISSVDKDRSAFVPVMTVD